MGSGDVEWGRRLGVASSVPVDQPELLAAVSEWRLGRARHCAASPGDQQNIARDRAESRQILGVEARPFSADIVPKALRDSQL